MGRIGTIVAERYRLDGVLGRGGSGVVYRATHTLTQRPVALKLLEFTEASDQDKVTRFLQEGQAAVKLQHPHVVEVLDMGRLEDGSVYLALELLRGESLADLLQKKKRLPQEQALEILLPIMDAVDAAHRAGLIHRDLKPANIYLHDAGDRIVPKLLDFGIVKDLGGSMATTKVGQIVGTPYFMAPEQAAGKAVGPPTDVWSMGVVLYAVLSGRLPFQGPNHFAVLMAIASGEHEPLVKVAPHVGRELAAVIESALIVDPKDRPKDMQRFRLSLMEAAPTGPDTLDDFEAETQADRVLEIPSLPAADTRTLPDRPPPRRLPLLAGALVIVALAGIAFAGLRKLEQPVDAPLAPKTTDTPPAPAPPPVVDATPESDAANAAQDELDRHVAELKSVLAKREQELQGLEKIGSSLEAIELARADMKRAQAQLTRCEHELELQAGLRSKWRIADEMFAKGEGKVAIAYYRELEAATRSLLAVCRETPPLVVASVAPPPPPPPPEAPPPPPEAPPPPPEPKADPKSAKDLYTRALALRDKGKLDGALAALNEAITVAPEFVAALNSRALLHQQRGKLDAALADFDRALALADDNASIHYNRAQARIAKRDTFGALADLDRAISLDAKTARYFESRANVHTLRDNPKQAAEDLARAIELEPARTDLRLRRARALIALHQNSEAEAELTAVIAAAPSAEVHFLRGTALLEQKKLDAAIKDFTETLTREPTHERALFQRGVARGMLDDKKEAIADFEQFLVLAPTSRHRELAEKWLARLKR